jgi:hypothetical protein
MQKKSDKLTIHRKLEIIIEEMVEKELSLKDVLRDSLEEIQWQHDKNG